MVQKRKNRTARHAWSPAYIDSGLIGAYILGVIIFAVWISYITQAVIAPWWLGTSIVAVTLYEMMILWLIRQYWEADKIFAIFTSNIVCLSLVFLIVELVTQVRLPTDLPAFSVLVYLSGIEATSVNPGVVAVSYALIAVFSGLIVMSLYALVDNTAAVTRLKRALMLDKIDLAIDSFLDRYSFWMLNRRYPWFVTPQVLLVLLLAVVVGLAALL